MKAAKISVIIPVYNVELYLRECLDSVINQTLKDIEIICVNDGSTDGSLEILKEYAQKDERIKVINKKNEGAGVARNDGLKIATGEYIIFFDSDDYMNIETLETLYNNITSTEADISICRSYDFIDGENKINKIDYSIKKYLINNKSLFCPQEVKEYIFQFCVGWPWDKLYRRKFILKNNLTFQNQHHSNDTRFVLLSLTCANKISIIDAHLVYHRKSSVSLESSRVKAPSCFYNALVSLYNELNKRHLYQIYEQSFVNYCIVFPLWHIKTINNKCARNVMIKNLKNLLTRQINLYEYNESYFYDKGALNEILTILHENNNLWEQIFSVRNNLQKTHKVITIFGIKIKVKRKKK